MPSLSQRLVMTYKWEEINFSLMFESIFLLVRSCPVLKKPNDRKQSLILTI